MIKSPCRRLKKKRLPTLCGGRIDTKEYRKLLLLIMMKGRQQNPAFAARSSSLLINQPRMRKRMCSSAARIMCKKAEESIGSSNSPSVNDKFRAGKILGRRRWRICAPSFFLRYDIARHTAPPMAISSGARERISIHPS